MSSDQTLYGDDFNLILSASAIQNEDLGLLLTISDNQNNEWSSMFDHRCAGNGSNQEDNTGRL